MIFDWLTIDRRSAGRGSFEGSERSISLCMDASGSMRGEKIDQAKKALCSFVDEVDLTQNEAGLVVFGPRGRASMAHHLTRSVGQLKRSINRFAVRNTTPFLGALKVASRMLKGCYGRPVIVIASDGHPTDASNSNILRYGKELKNEGIHIITIAIGSKADRKFLTKLASSPEDAHISRVKELPKTYRQIASKLTVRKE